MVVRINDISKEDKPRFVSRRQRQELRQEFESIASRAKRAKPDDDAEHDAERDLAATQPTASARHAAKQNSAEQNSAGGDGADQNNMERVGGDGAAPAIAYPRWRLEKERQLQSAAAAAGGAGSKEAPKKWFEKTRGEMTPRDWRIMRADLQIACASAPDLQPLLSWRELPDAALGAALAQGPYARPTPVQRATVPLALQGDDVIGIAQTGSGKTLSFAVPLLLARAPQALVLAPTRELALQIADVLGEFAPAFGAHVVALVGGRDFAQQQAELEAAATAAGAGARVLVATPGRLLDFADQQLVRLADCTFLVLDEADRMIDLGFEEQLAQIMARLPPRQTLMYTATWPRAIQALAARFTRPRRTHKVEVGAARRSLSVRQSAELLDSPAAKTARAAALVQAARPPVIVFAATRAACDALAPRLPRAAPLHGSMSQERREAAVRALRSGAVGCIVATDVASRGLDVPDVSLVVNYDMPGDVDTYMHRIGRTGRAGKQGRAVSLCLASDAPLFADLRRVLRDSAAPVPAFLAEASAPPRI